MKAITIFFEFTNEELIDLVSKKDEWSKLDYLLAQKILKERGQEITHNKIKELTNERIVDLSTHEKSQTTFIIWGYIFALLGGIIGILIAWHLKSSKKILPSGDQVYVYSEYDRKQANIIQIISCISIILAIIVRFFYE